jgi:hypothetical protein
MKVGDLVMFKDIEGRHGTLISCGVFAEGWWDILDDKGRLVVWPETQLSVINEGR